jgi:hypothetical protein
MGSHDAFGHLKHNIWPKERLEVKLTIWLLTIKSRESIRFPYVQVACDIPLKISWRGLQLFFKPHCNWRSAHKAMGHQNHKSPNFGNFTKSHLGVPRQNAIWMWPLWRDTIYTIKGKVVVSSKSRLWWVLWVWGCLWFCPSTKSAQTMH